jgi:hypothetical protein
MGGQERRQVRDASHPRSGGTEFTERKGGRMPALIKGAAAVLTMDDARRELAAPTSDPRRRVDC